MRKIYLPILLLSFLLPSFIFSIPSTPIQFFYVSPEGDDSNEGSLENPLKSFEGAKEVVQKFKNEHPQTPITIYFRGGKYYLSQAIIFTQEDGGSEVAPISYKAYPGEKPYVLGGAKLELKWKKHKDGIFKAKVPKGIIFESLFVNDELQVLARYPNYNPQVRIFKGYASDCIAPERVKKWKNPAGGYYHVIHGNEWGGFHFQITGKKTENELAFTGGWQNNRPEGGQHKTFRYVENIYEELDTLNEWYLDKEASMLYFYPSSSMSLASANIEFAALENLVSFVGTESEPVRHISLDGFTFMRSVRTFLKNREPLLRSDWTIYRGGAIFFEGTEDCRIVNCEISQVGGNAIFFNHYNKNNVVEGCHIHEIGANAICLVGDTAAVRNPKFVPYGPRVTEEEMDRTPGPKGLNFPQNCVVEDNLIHDFGTIEKQVAGVEISMCANITLRHNSIYNAPRAGINIGEGAWGGHLLEYNDVFNTVLETGDHGSFNSWGRDRFWGVPKGKTDEIVAKDRSIIMLDMMAPNVIRNNRFRCDHGWDIDLDDGSSYYEIYNNLCLNGGIKLREGYYRNVQNNICVNNGLHPHVWQENSGDIVRGNIFSAVHQPIFVDEWGREVNHNWFVYPEDLEKVHHLNVDQNSLAGDPLFVDPQAGDFSVALESKVYGIGWKNFPMDKFGVQKSSLKAIAATPEIPPIQKPNIEIHNHVYFYGGRIKNLVSEGEMSATGMSGTWGVMVLSSPNKGVFKNLELKRNDVIIGINDTKVENVTTFRSLFEENNLTSLTIWRDQQSTVLTP